VQFLWDLINQILSPVNFVARIFCLEARLEGVLKVAVGGRQMNDETRQTHLLWATRQGGLLDLHAISFNWCNRAETRIRNRGAAIQEPIQAIVPRGRSGLAYVEGFPNASS